jgi:hypothetical protein
MKKVTALLVGAALALAVNAPAAIASSVKNPAGEKAFNPQRDPPHTATKQQMKGPGAPAGNATQKMGVSPEPFRQQSGSPGPKGGAAEKALLPAVQQPGGKQR